MLYLGQRETIPEVDTEIYTSFREVFLEKQRDDDRVLIVHCECTDGKHNMNKIRRILYIHKTKINYDKMARCVCAKEYYLYKMCKECFLKKSERYYSEEDREKAIKKVDGVEKIHVLCRREKSELEEDDHVRVILHSNGYEELTTVSCEHSNGLNDGSSTTK